MGFTPTIDQARVVRQIGALRAGTFHVIDFTDLEGLITMPSFHAAGAMMVTWAFRRHRAVFLPLVIISPHQQPRELSASRPGLIKLVNVDVLRA